MEAGNITSGDIALGMTALTYGGIFIAIPLAPVMLLLFAIYLEFETRVWRYCEQRGLRCPKWADPHYNPYEGA